jgi:hypothetical protein
MIGGIIVLGLFLTSLGAMILVTQQYDTYQQTAARMSQADIQRFSEYLVFNSPGIDYPGTPISCAGASGCTAYTLNMTNLAGIGTQVARIYINSTFTGCVSPCILDPASSPTAYRFRSSDRYITPSETYHLVLFWLPTDTISNQVLNTISVVTTRGRVFTLQFPLPAEGGSIPSPSGGMNLGCIAIKVDPFLVTYTSPDKIYPQMPFNNGWQFPYNTYLIFYVKMSNICTSPIILLDRSGFTARRYTGTGTGSLKPFYIASPMASTPPNNYCQYFPGTDCVNTGSGGNTAPSPNGVIQAYNSSQLNYQKGGCTTSDPCYILRPSFSRGTPGLPMYVLFSAKDIGSAATTKFSSGQNLYVGFLALYWQCTTYDDKTCPPNYTFGITLPFITFSTFQGP